MNLSTVRRALSAAGLAAMVAVTIGCSTTEKCGPTNYVESVEKRKNKFRDPNTGLWVYQDLQLRTKQQLQPPPVPAPHADGAYHPPGINPAAPNGSYGDLPPGVVPVPGNGLPPGQPPLQPTAEDLPPGIPPQSLPVPANYRGTSNKK